MSPVLQMLIGLLAAFSGAGSACLLVLGDQSRDEPETYIKAIRLAKWLAVFSILGFLALVLT